MSIDTTIDRIRAANPVRVEETAAEALLAQILATPGDPRVATAPGGMPLSELQPTRQRSTSPRRRKYVAVAVPIGAAAALAVPAFGVVERIIDAVTGTEPAPLPLGGQQDPNGAAGPVIVPALSAGAATKTRPVCAPGTISTAARPCSATPRCRIGQKSTKAVPCNDPVHASLMDIATKALAARAVASLVTVLDSSKGLFRLSVPVPSWSGRGFTWHPPAGMTVKSVSSAKGGKCELVTGGITCRRVGAGPLETCCLVTADFYADGAPPNQSAHGNSTRWYGTGTLTRVP